MRKFSLRSLACTSSITLALLFPGNAGAQQVLEPARVSCNAAYSAPCARTNSKWLASQTADELFEQLQQGIGEDDLFQAVTKGNYNMDIGFYPFLMHRNTSVCFAHGADPSFVGLNIASIFSKVGIAFSDADALHARFVAAAEKEGGDWVSYLWSDGGATNSKLAFVTALTDEYYVGVGYENVQLPPDLPCSAQFDSLCSITNVRSLLGKAQFHLQQADSLENFEAAIFDLSFAPDFQIQSDFYTFMYNYDGRLKSHAVLHGDFGKLLADIVVEKESGTREEGQVLHESFVQAAEGTGWLQYKWRNSMEDDPYTKIAFLVKIEFESDQYYLGVGFNFAVDKVAAGPFGELCSPDYNLPCAFSTSLQMSSHALAHAVSSPTNLRSTFDAISSEPGFRVGSFYTFAYGFDGTCVAHGQNSNYVGKTLNEVYESVQINLDADILHEQFRNAARKGGDWVMYDWLLPGVANSDFQKIAYIFHMNLDGRDYYGGVGFDHTRFPVQEFVDSRTKKNEDPILCSPKYGLECSEANARAILGQAVADLTVASSNAVVTSEEFGSLDFDEVLMRISNQENESYLVNDFYVMVFSFDSSMCSDDLSGCCLAHGGDASFVGQTWQQILDAKTITSIQGADIHRRLLRKASSSGGGAIEYPWSRASGAAQIKRAWTARFRYNEKDFYVVTEYLKTDLPPTCDACPDPLECTDNEEQEFCKEKPGTPLHKNPLVISLIVLFSVGTPLVSLFFWTQKRRSKARSRKKLEERDEEIQRMAEQMKQQMQGMVEVMYDMPIHSPEKYRQKVQQTEHMATSTAGVWYWEESDSYVSSHKPSMVLANSNFIQYSSDVSDQLERAYQLYREGRGYHEFHLDLTNKISSTVTGGKVSNADTGLHYDVDFNTMQQNNTSSKYKRNIHREEIQINIDAEILGELPPLPEDINFFGGEEKKDEEKKSEDGESGEDLLPTFTGQVIQVSKVHPNGDWLYGNVLYDPLLNDAQKQPEGTGTASLGLNAMLASALHDRPTSGWFPKSVTTPADVNVMQNLLNTLGGEGVDTLKPPRTWIQEANSPSFKAGLVEVSSGTAEYTEVANYFTRALYAQKDNVKVKKIERIQNTPLWQSYAVKKQTVKTRDTNSPQYRINNRDSNDIERKWLFHGTTQDVISKIEKQGFNRAFAGRNAVAFGKGVYFARDSAYSSHKTYSAPDKKNIQRMFLCRVVVGDWCKGTDGQLTPNAKPHNPLELFDSTVDNPTNPSIFVVYHDAQAYPEYLVSFQRTKEWTSW